MAGLFRLLIFGLIITAGFYLFGERIRPAIQARMAVWEQKLTEVVNPTVKQKRLLTNLDANLREINTTATILKNVPISTNKEVQLQNLENLTNQSQELLHEINKIAQEQNPTITSALLRKLLPQSILPTPPINICEPSPSP